MTTYKGHDTVVSLSAKFHLNCLEHSICISLPKLKKKVSWILKIPRFSRLTLMYHTTTHKFEFKSFTKHKKGAKRIKKLPWQNFVRLFPRMDVYFAQNPKVKREVIRYVNFVVIIPVELYTV